MADLCILSATRRTQPNTRKAGLPMRARALKAMSHPGRPGRNSRFYLLLSAVVVLLIAFETLLSSLPFAEEVLSKLTDFQLKELETYVEMNKLLTTLATLTIGATTGFVANQAQRGALPPSELRKAVASWILAAASLYCGHLSYQQMIWMLDQKFFNLFYSHVWWPTRRSSGRF